MTRLLIILLLSAIVWLAGCTSGAPVNQPLQLVETTASYRLIRHTFGETRAPLAPQRILALGEESLLADLLDAGFRPVASNVNVPDNVPLLATEELAGIALFPSANDISLETLSAYQPDLIIGTRFFIEQIGYERLSKIAPTIALSGATPLENYVETLAVFGRGEEAQRTVANFRAEVQVMANRLNAAGQSVSMMTIYPGPNVALWFDGPSPIPLLVRELGIQFRPDPATVNGLNIRNGRAFISLEQLTLASGETILLLQTSGVEGEAQAVVELQANPLWQQLPAVQAQRVVILDRIGYPGLRGQRALLADLQQALSP
ncbi:ABC transporter substrate-binding protein [Chloroflexus islandicus]|uniref:ABC transporter substrate-binding protein n=1 Tax=Chloroflexus islandicus TaxID=1707952 RepID=A0A178LSY8_9CHLR|nr:ABC transporter substrate-binding protein [Chloroflexus islandicus]OAN36334.1 ABC transporter substrate-binding protein [Chloroflexus islandicus]